MAENLNKIIIQMLNKAMENKILPIRYPSTGVVKIKKGYKKGFFVLKPKTKPRRNGAFYCYAIILSNKKGDYILVPVDIPKIDPIRI